MPSFCSHCLDDLSSLPSSLWHLYVLLLELLALALTRAILPSLHLDSKKKAIGCTKAVRGLLAFVACPLFRKISDIVGQRICLLVTVAGTLSSVCSLALLPPRGYDLDLDMTAEGSPRGAAEGTTVTGGNKAWGATLNFPHPSSSSSSGIDHIWVFVMLLSLSGLFSLTFTLTFAYISDTFSHREDRVGT